MEEKVLVLLEKMKKPISFEELRDVLGIENPNEEELLERTIQKLILSYKICTINSNLILMDKTPLKTGYFYKNKDGNGFVYVTITYEDKKGNNIEREEKYKVKRKDNKGAIDGDKVLINVNYKDKTAKIETIISRQINNVVGKVYKIGNSYFVKSNDPKKMDLIVAIEEAQCKEGDMVEVELIDKRSDNFYIGNVTKIFNQTDELNQKILLEAYKLGMPGGFSKKTEEQLKYIPTKVRKEDFVGRRDLTNWEIFSIDGKDTKDKDDCISIEKLPNGHVLLGVHIADVAYYVPENSPIDKDAFLKGTSYYFGGCVEPQLPRKLSNGICSLEEEKNRLAKTILIEYDEQGNVISREIFKSVIRSKIGMNYDEVNKLLTEGTSVPKYEKYYGSLLEMKKLAEKLYKKRIENGAITFNEIEDKFKYDEFGIPIDITYRYHRISEKIIEEFMLAANNNVGSILQEQDIPCIYRNHASPDEEKIKSYLEFIKLIGIPFYSRFPLDKKELQLLITHINNDNISPQIRNLLNKKLICSMAKAEYSSKNTGHYCTSFDTYSHFTSPIRRLADYAISRILDECYFETNLDKKEKNIKKWREQALIYAQRANEMECVEERVEREVNAINKARFLSNYIDQEFEGTIVEIGTRGIKVQLDNLLTGHIRFTNLPGIYKVDEEHSTILSRDNLMNYYIGDRLKLQLFDTNIETGLVDFKVIEKISENNYYQKDYTEEEFQKEIEIQKLKIRQKKNKRKKYKS